MRYLVLLLLLYSCNYRCVYDCYDYKTSEFIASHWYGDYTVCVEDTSLTISGRNIDIELWKEKDSHYAYDYNNKEFIFAERDGRFYLKTTSSHRPYEEFIFYGKRCWAFKKQDMYIK